MEPQVNHSQALIMELILREALLAVQQQAETEKQLNEPLEPELLAKMILPPPEYAGLVKNKNLSHVRAG